MYKNCFPPPFEWTENQISFHRTTWTVDSNCGGKESYTKTLKPKSKGWMLQLGKTGYIVRSGRVIGDLWYRWHVLDRSRPIPFELRDLCAVAAHCTADYRGWTKQPVPYFGVLEGDE